MTYQFDWTEKWALYNPERIAFSEYKSGRQINYWDLNRMGNRLANYFSDELGLVKGDRIAVLSENCLEYIYLFVAAQKLGFIIVPLNYRLAKAEIAYLIGNSDPKVLIVDSKFEQKTPDINAIEKVQHVQTLKSIRERCDSSLEHPYDISSKPSEIVENDPIFILHTSGTTGFPKGSIYTHKMLFWNSINTSLSLIINTESRTINCMPPFHTGGWNVLTTPFLHHGGYTCMMRSFDALHVLQSIQKERITILMCVPTMLKMIADLPEFETTDLSSLLYVIVGGEPMPIPLIQKWHERNVFIRQGFGMTEAGPNLTSLHQEDAERKMGSIGRTNFYVQTKIIDDKGVPCGVNEAGELLLKGPMVTPGYWRDDDATKASFMDGWFKTGDRVYQDEEAYLFVVDRIKNLFISWW